MKISLVINCDTRPQRHQTTGTNEGGCVSWDFLRDGVENKKKFLEGFDFETILFVDQHQLGFDFARGVDCLAVRKHDPTFPNDSNYMAALSLARGDIVMHFDADVVAFRRSEGDVESLLDYIQEHRFVSYPSPCWPRPMNMAVRDESFGGRSWVSTRFFAGRREHLQITELDWALRNPQDAYAKYGRPPRECPWTEHMLALINENSVIYPRPQDLPGIRLWSWGKYIDGTIGKLNNMSFEEVCQYVERCGGISYPCDLEAKPI